MDRYFTVEQVGSNPCVGGVEATLQLLNSSNPVAQKATWYALFLEAPSTSSFKAFYYFLEGQKGFSNHNQAALFAAANREEWGEVKHLFQEGACGYNIIYGLTPTLPSLLMLPPSDSIDENA